MYQKLLLFCCCWYFSINTLSAQAPPNTNIYLFQIEQLTDSLIQVNNPQLLTNFNAQGYNNQPRFFSDDELYFTSQQPAQQQPDIYAFNLRRNTKTQITNTPEGEYSPTLTPDASYFSAVRVEADDAGTQRLWEFPTDRNNNGKPVFKYVKGVGYHYWLNNYQVAMFIVGEPNTMVVGDTRTDKTLQIATNIGRCFQDLPNGNMAYVHKENDYTYYIKSFNPYSRKSKTIVKTLPGSEDFAVLPEGTIIMGKGSKLYKYHPAYDTDWLEISDLRYYNIRKISRLAVSDDFKLALVSE